MDHLMALVQEEGQRCHKKPPIRIGGGIVNIPDGEGGAAKKHHPEDHWRKSQHPPGKRQGSSQRG
jgi:hypothetical protein